MADKNQKTISSLAAAVSRINQQQHQDLGQHNASGTIRSSNNAGGATVTSSLSSSSMKPPRVANKSEEAYYHSHHHHKKQQQQQKEYQQVTTHPGQKEQLQIKSSLARALEKEEGNKKNKEKGHEVSSSSDSDKKHTNASHGTTGINTTHATTSTHRREVGKEAGKVSKNKSNDNNSTTNTTRSGRRTQNTYRHSSRSIDLHGGNDNAKDDGNLIPRSSSSSSSTGNSNKSRTRNIVQNGKVHNGNASNRPYGNSVGRSRLPMKHDHHSGESGYGKSDLKQFTKQMDNLHVTTSIKGYRQQQQQQQQRSASLSSSSAGAEQEQKVSLQHDNQIHNNMLKPRLVSKSEVPVGNFDSSQIVLNWADDSSDDDDDYV